MSIIKKVILITILGLVLIFAFFWVLLSSKINKKFIKSDAFKATILYLQNDSLAQNRLGEIVNVDRSVSGYLTPKESARLVFDIYTLKEEVTVKCRLKYEQNKWVIQEIEYH